MKQLIIVFLILIGMQSMPAQDYSILTFGAVADGETLNTLAIQSAIDKAHQNGGGRVIIPAGRFLSGSILLKSGVELYLQKKATLLGSTDPDNYIKLRRRKALVMADGAQGIAIGGKGTLDGQGAQLGLYLDSLFHIGQVDSAGYNFVEKRPRWNTRPQLIEFVNCENIRVIGVTLKNAACWVQTYDLCQNLVIDNIRVESDAYWNNDGIDIVDCQNVRITNCYVNAADDGICLKSHRYNQKKGPRYCDSIYIADCTVRSSASAIKFGTNSFGGFKNIVIKNIKVFDTFRSAIAIESVDGGIIENVLVDNIKARNTANAIFIRIGKRRKNLPAGILRNVVIKNIKVEVPFERTDYAYNIRGPELPFFHNVFPASITGLPEHAVENVTLENIKITYPGRGHKAYAYMGLYRLEEVPENANHYPEFSMFGELPAWGFYVRHVDGLTMKNVKVKIKKADYRPAFVFDDVKDLNMQSIQIDGDKKTKAIIFNNVEEVKK